MGVGTRSGFLVGLAGAPSDPRRIGGGGGGTVPGEGARDGRAALFSPRLAKTSRSDPSMLFAIIAPASCARERCFRTALARHRRRELTRRSRVGKKRARSFAAARIFACIEKVAMTASPLTTVHGILSRCQARLPRTPVETSRASFGSYEFTCLRWALGANEPSGSRSTLSVEAPPSSREP
jgi:hypothetical protein